MADFSNTANTGNNPDEWFTNYAYTAGTDLVSFSLNGALPQTGVLDDDLDADSGDVRSVYLAVAEALFQAYDGKDASASTTSTRLRMTKSQAIQNFAPIQGNADGVEEDIRYTTYTIHVQEEGETSSFFVPKGVKAE